MDTLQEKQKQIELEKTMAIFSPQCRKKHPLKEFPLNIVEACIICEQTHVTSLCPSLIGLKAIFQGESEENAVDQLYFMGPKNPRQPRPPAMNPGMHPQTNMNPSWNQN